MTFVPLQTALDAPSLVFLALTCTCSLNQNYGYAFGPRIKYGAGSGTRQRQKSGAIIASTDAISGLMERLYQISGLVFSYSGRKVLDLDDHNRVTAVVGPNGSGKSTLFDLLAFLRKPDTGRILFRGKPTSGINSALLRRQVGYIQQKPYLMKMSVRDNIGLGLKFRGEARTVINAAVNAVAGELGLGALLDRDAGRLSGGETQKVALARPWRCNLR